MESGLVVYQGLRSMSEHALVDIYRCYEIWLTVAEAAKLQQGNLMEVGMWRASTGAVIAAECQTHPSAHLVLCDIHLSG